MRSTDHLFFAILVILTLPTHLTAAVAGDPQLPGESVIEDADGYVPDEILLELSGFQADVVRARLDNSLAVAARDTGLASLDALGERFGATSLEVVFKRPWQTRQQRRREAALDRVFLLKLGAGQDVHEALAAYREVVPHAQLNYVYASDLYPADTLFPDQYAHQLTDAEAGWDIEVGDPSVIIAVLGTGVEVSHEDLDVKITAGWDFIDGDADPSPAGSNHETLVAGVAAAQSANVMGVTGVCWFCLVMPVRASYTTSQMAQAIDFATYASPRARVINMSFGNYDVNKYGPDSIVGAALDRADAAGIVLVASAGNDAVTTKRYPAADDKVIAVASSNSLDRRSLFSNHGRWVTVAAPGEGVWSTDTGNSYSKANGTSFATPYVSGVVGLLLSKDPSLSPGEVRQRIEYLGDQVQMDRFVGSTRINVARILAADGLPPLFAVIKEPSYGQGFLAEDGPVDVFGTVLGNGGFDLEIQASYSTSWDNVASGAQAFDAKLATIDVPALGTGSYQLRLTAHDGSESAENLGALTVTRLADFVPGWPQPGQGAPIYADLDGDGDQEIVVTKGNTVHVFHHDGTMAAGWPSPESMRISGAPPAIGDIDGDQDLELVFAGYVGESDFGGILAWHHEGTPVAGLPVSCGSDLHGPPALANLDSDPALEIIAYSRDGCVGAWNGDGSPVDGWPVSTEAFDILKPLAAGDIDGDGDTEVVVGTKDHLNAYHHDGTLVSGWPVPLSYSATAPILVDMDRDAGALEIVTANNSGIFALDGNGTTRLSIPLTKTYGFLAAGDLDGDEAPEVVITTSSGEIFVYHLTTGQLMSEWSMGQPNPWGGVVIADIDGDGDREVLKDAQYSIFAWEADGTPVSGWPKGTLDNMSKTPAYGDFDGDGLGEVAVAGYSQTYVWATGQPFDPKTTDWPMEQGNARRNGVYVSPARLFADGFESGSTSAWSLVKP